MKNLATEAGAAKLRCAKKQRTVVVEEVGAEEINMSRKKPRGRGKTRKPKLTETVYQFKIQLLDVKPPIWRRIQVTDSTLDKLHEHIQTAMGWTNSHLHQFDIKGERYGDPELLDDGFQDFECVRPAGLFALLAWASTGIGLVAWDQSGRPAYYGYSDVLASKAFLLVALRWPS
jgi:hypothetical protein